MKLALISDIHGNYKALEAFLNYMEQHPTDAVISLGDYITDAPYPERTMALLYGMREKYPCYMLRGNREDYILDNEGNGEGWKPSSANGTLYYTLQHITEKDKAFFRTLPTEREVCIEGCPSLYICHGTPGRVRGNVHQEEGLKEKVLAPAVICWEATPITRKSTGGREKHISIPALWDSQWTVWAGAGSLPYLKEIRKGGKRNLCQFPMM